ncbi:MAG: hypothetical protein WD824_06675 [Cyclobacteriaceae bacterium]
MADERDFELLDDYLTNRRMSEQDRSAFEQRLQADPDLQHEYALQKRLIKGIQDARIAELKSMLNQVPIPANNPGNTVATKIILGTVVTLMIAVATFWYLNRDEIRLAEPEIPSQEQAPGEKIVIPEAGTEIKPEGEQSAINEKQIVESDKNQTSAGTEQSKPSLAKKPDPLNAPGDKSEQIPAKEPVLDVFNPDSGVSDSDNSLKKENQPVYNPGNSSLMVETDRENRRYTFHYQFRDGKLFLYGPFEKNLYEIMEFFADEKRTVFLYYKDRYYLLEEADNKVRTLTPITDPALIKKLKEYRSSK